MCVCIALFLKEILLPAKLFKWQWLTSNVSNVITSLFTSVCDENANASDHAAKDGITMWHCHDHYRHDGEGMVTWQLRLLVIFYACFLINFETIDIVRIVWVHASDWKTEMC